MNGGIFFGAEGRGGGAPLIFVQNYFRSYHNFSQFNPSLSIAIAIYNKYCNLIFTKDLE
jgi:hypothetical protein